jgi:hypothetical protein
MYLRNALHDYPEIGTLEEGSMVSCVEKRYMLISSNPDKSRRARKGRTW